MAPLTRRTMIAGVAALPVLGVAKTFVGSIANPIPAAIVAYRAAVEEYWAAHDAYSDLLEEHDRLATSGIRSALEVTWHGLTAAETRLQSTAEAMLAAERTAYAEANEWLGWSEADAAAFGLVQNDSGEIPCPAARKHLSPMYAAPRRIKASLLFPFQSRSVA